MLKIRKIALVAVATMASVTLSFGDMPSINDLNLKMGNTDTRQSRYAGTYSYRGEWNKNEVYNGSFTQGVGDTVKCGTYCGKPLFWWAGGEVKGYNKPGEFTVDGSMQSWVLINSSSVDERGKPNYKWSGWNGDIQESISGISAVVPTWRDGAEAAYTMTHEDMGAMSFIQSIRPAWELAEEAEFAGVIKQSWGIIVEKMDQESWDNTLMMVMDGHEMFSHSNRHTNPADQWQVFWPGQIINSYDPSIPEEIRGLEVVGIWAAEPNNLNPQKTPTPNLSANRPTTVTLQDDSGLVSITSTCQWTQDAPASEPIGWDISKDGEPENLVIEPVITALAGTEVVILPSKQKQYVRYSYRDESGGGNNEGLIAATGAIWYSKMDIQNFAAQSWKDAANSAAMFTDSDGKLKFEYSVSNENGAGGYAAKILCRLGWDSTGNENDYKDNVEDASAAINENIYSRIINSGEHFPKGKRVEYFGYPFDSYSERTHAYLEKAGIVGARGGAKTGQPIPGDFIHPYRINFDDFYITQTTWDATKTSKDENGLYVSPQNPFVKLGLNELVDETIKAKGYMVRKFHSVADMPEATWYNEGEPFSTWPVNDPRFGGWFGGITKDQLRVHYRYLKKMIDERKLTVYTPSEAIKYRLTANVAGTPGIERSGANYLLTVPTTELIRESDIDEISVIVSFGEPMEKMNIEYSTLSLSQIEKWGNKPRRLPRMMDTEGKIWSISVNPYLGEAVIEPNADWELPSSIKPHGTGVNSIKPSLAGIHGGKVALNLPVGNYTAEIFSVSGRLIASSNIISSGGVVKSAISTERLGAGMFILNVKVKNGAQVMPSAKFLVK